MRAVRCSALLFLFLLATALPAPAAESVDDLVAQLKSGDAAARRDAAKALGGMGSKAESAVPALEEALQDPDRSVQHAAAWALERIRGKRKGRDAKSLVSEAAEYYRTKVKPLYQKYVLSDSKDFSDAELDELIDGMNKVIDLYAEAQAADDEANFSATIKEMAKKVRGPMLERDRRKLRKKMAERKKHRPPPTVKREPGNKPTPEPEPEPEPEPKRPSEVDALVSRLKSSKGAQRRQVAAELGKYGDDAVEALAKILDGEQKDLQAGAALALYHTGSGRQAAVITLMTLLDEKDLAVRLEATEALGVIGPLAAPAVPGLIYALKDDDAKVRAAAARTLGRIGPKAKRASMRLSRGLRDGEQEVRYESARALGGVGPAADAAVPELLRALASDDPELARLTVEALGMIGPETKTVMPALMEQLKSLNRDVREAAIRAIGHIGPEAKKATAALLNILVIEQYAELKAAAEQALAAIGEDAVPQVVKALKDDRADLRLNACRILAAMGPRAKKALSGLRGALKDKHPDVRMAAIEALGKLGPEGRGAASALGKLLQDEQWRTRVAAAKALGEIGPPAKGALTKLVSALQKDEEAEVRAAAATAIGRMGSDAKSAASALEKAKSDANEAVRKAAGEALAAVRA